MAYSEFTRSVPPADINAPCFEDVDLGIIPDQPSVTCYRMPKVPSNIETPEWLEEPVINFHYVLEEAVGSRWRCSLGRTAVQYNTLLDSFIYPTGCELDHNIEPYISKMLYSCQKAGDMFVLYSTAPASFLFPVFTQDSGPILFHLWVRVFKWGNAQLASDEQIQGDLRMIWDWATLFNAMGYLFSKYPNTIEGLVQAQEVYADFLTYFQTVRIESQKRFRHACLLWIQFQTLPFQYR